MGLRRGGPGQWRPEWLRGAQIALAAALSVFALGWALAAEPDAGSDRRDWGSEVAFKALAFLGVPYRYGGDDPVRGFDCSGLVRHVARAVLAVDLPRRSQAMARAGQGVAHGALRAGDLVFFSLRGQRDSHVGIYLGDGRFVHAPARRGRVRIESMHARYWQSRFSGARRLIEAQAVSEPAPAATVPQSLEIMPSGNAPAERDTGPEVDPIGGA